MILAGRALPHSAPDCLGAAQRAHQRLRALIEPAKAQEVLLQEQATGEEWGHLTAPVCSPPIHRATHSDTGHEADGYKETLNEIPEKPEAVVGEWEGEAASMT